jgi:hypothetical protein
MPLIALRFVEELGTHIVLRLLLCPNSPQEGAGRHEPDAQGRLRFRSQGCSGERTCLHRSRFEMARGAA